jgi:tRNA-dihydrouridine synthase A
MRASSTVGEGRRTLAGHPEVIDIVIRGTTRPLAVAPMMGHTDPIMRGILRRLTRHTLLYTEMVTATAIVHGDDNALVPPAADGPVALQLGGSDATELTAAARIAEQRGYDEVDLNVGCPSSRATGAVFGACLMRTPDVVAAALGAMRAAVSVPVTVKCRIGVDHADRYDDLVRFVDAVAPVADRVTVHARKAWLDGLSPRANRNTPPLRPADVHRLKRERPDVPVVVNGGVRTLDAAVAHLDHVDGVMIGRAAVDDPYLFAAADATVFGDDRDVPSRGGLVMDTVAANSIDGVVPPRVLDRLLGVFHGQRGARAWRRDLSALRERGGVTRADVADLLARMPTGVG